MKIKELKNYVQSANINFLIGSGASRPYLSALGDIEKLLTSLQEERDGGVKKDIVKASIYKAYYDNVIKPNRELSGSEYETTKNNYQEFLSIWNSLLNKRYSRILSKQGNIFSTNIDLMVEDAASDMGIELNDGFRGSVAPIFDEGNFMKSVFQTSLHFQHMSEIPVFNLLKMHGSVNWEKKDDHIVYGRSWWSEIEKVLDGIDDNKFIDIYNVDPDGKKHGKTILQMLSEAKGIGRSDKNIMVEFMNAYDKFIIVNPTKRKFSETVMDEHFYELMRIFSNALEKENSILFAIGFSFADEHIAAITRRAAENNPTLKVVVFAYHDDEEVSFKEKLGLGSTCINNNIEIVTPTNFKDANKGDEYEGMTKGIGDYFDLGTVNKVFAFLNNSISVSYE